MPSYFVDKHLATAQQLLRDMLRDGTAEHGDAAHFLKAAIMMLEKEKREANKVPGIS